MSQITLGRLIEVLEGEPPLKVVAQGFGSGHSYRGYYEQLAFEHKENAMVGSMLSWARTALGAVYPGWKGGEFYMGPDTLVSIADWGMTEEDDELTEERLRLMLATPGQVS